MSEIIKKTDSKIIVLPGVCCFCGFECNPLSQSCGTCARNINGYQLGLSLTIPKYIKQYERKKE
jgi:hypothetical protein